MRSQLARLLGGFTPAHLTLEKREMPPAPSSDIRIEKLKLRRPNGVVIRAFLTAPAQHCKKLPAILYAHAHGNRYAIGAAELIEGRPALLDPPYGIAFAKAGYLTLALDLPCFGERQEISESAAAKHALWYGRTLFGAMLEDLAGGFAFLAAHSDVDAARIGMFGLSMGATLTFWLGALEPRIKAAAHLLSFADLDMLAKTPAHDLHGIYMMVPGLLSTCRTGQIAGLIAPRPQFAGMGALDPLTPPDAIMQACADAQAAYTAQDARDAFDYLVSEGSGHKETQAMRNSVLNFFQTHLSANLCAEPYVHLI